MNLIADRKFEIDETSVYLKLYNLYKSILLLISDQKDMGIGNVTLGSPPVIEGTKSPTASYNLFGMESRLLSTIIAERVSKKLDAPVLLLLFFKNRQKEEDIIKPLVDVLNEILEEVKLD
ncbi:MAG: hypothetical protein ACFFFB_16340 [Candidatus Heimdallarchaeota archaeon]